MADIIFWCWFCKVWFRSYSRRHEPCGSEAYEGLRDIWGRAED